MKPMRKAVFVLFSLLLMLPLSACNSERGKEEVAAALGIDVSGGTETEHTDTHGGFHGDGTTFIALHFSDEACLNEIESSASWKPLPLSENLETLVYGQASGGPVLTSDKGDPLFPQVENGYYYLWDRHDESENRQDDSDLLQRASFNFTLALYDADAKTLYYCAFDT